MKLLYASEYRAAARSMLRGRWTEAVLVGLVASLLCGNINLGSSSAFRMNINLDTNSLSSQFDHMPEDANGIEWLMHLLTGGLAAGVLALLLIIGVAWLIVSLILGGVIETGYARYNMKLVNGSAAGFSDLFHEFGRWGTCLVMHLLRSILVFVGYMLLIIPGILLSYGFRMAPYILAEHPECGGWEALSESWRMMRGHKLRLFCLDISFIGWSLLCALTCGIGYLWLTPYTCASEAIFYLELAGDYYSTESRY